MTILKLYNGTEIRVKVIDADYDVEIDAYSKTPFTEWEDPEIYVKSETKRKEALEYLCESLSHIKNDDWKESISPIEISGRKDFDPDILRAIDTYNLLVEDWIRLREKDKGKFFSNE